MGGGEGVPRLRVTAGRRRPFLSSLRLLRNLGPHQGPVPPEAGCFPAPVLADPYHGGGDGRSLR
eukprot:9047911-Lingulodinium_polyedra.AAC.1